MNWLNRFNPAKSLFFRVFLCFWLAALLIFFSSIWLAKQLDSEAKYMPLDPQQKKDLKALNRKLQSRIDKRAGNIKINQVLNYVGGRNRYGLMLIDSSTGEVTHNVGRHRRVKEEVFSGFDKQSSPLMLEIEGIDFIGPGLLTFDKTDYLLFLVKPRPGGSLRVMRHEYPGLFIIFMASLSIGLCYLFVRGLLNPITQVRHASKRMATGEMGVRVGNASLRLDEFGQLGRDFNHMSKQVENLLNSQKRLLADISHELRSPLARLQLSIGIALQQNESDMPINIMAALERIEKEALQIDEMIAQVLLLSRLDNQQPIQNLQSVSLEQIMAPIITDATFEAVQKGKELSYKGLSYKECGDINLKVEPQLLSSAIENILRNAIHYSDCLIKVSVYVKSKHIEWVIEDDGGGIEESQLDKIFEAFYRESTARDRNSGGVGLGLAIAHHAINKHKGSIHASNREKGGLVVKISIPLKE